MSWMPLDPSIPKSKGSLPTLSINANVLRIRRLNESNCQFIIYVTEIQLTRREKAIVYQCRPTYLKLGCL